MSQETTTCKARVPPVCMLAFCLPPTCWDPASLSQSVSVSSLSFYAIGDPVTSQKFFLFQAMLHAGHVFPPF